MSSLLQFGGRVDKRGVHLQFYQTKPPEGPQPEWRKTNPLFGDPVDEVEDPATGKKHPRIHTAVRKPLGMFGHWVVFRYLGEEHVPDLSIPIAVFKLPRGARPMTDEETIKSWTT